MPELKRPKLLIVEDDAGLQRVRALVAQNQMIQAIKEYRAVTGVGLKEAKDAVEAIQRGQL